LNAKHIIICGFIQYIMELNNAVMKKIFYFLSAALNFCYISSGIAQNVGIGTTAPQSKLHVVDGPFGYSGGYSPGFILEGNGNRYMNLITPSANESGLLFGNPSDGAYSGGIIYNNTSTPFGLQFRTNGNQNRMIIDANGNIGIGAIPGFPLNFSSNVGDKIALWGSTGAHYGFGIQTALLQIHTDNSSSDIAFGFGSSGSFTENMRIKGTGVLQFPASLAKKIVFYPGSSGDANIGVFGNEFRIASDYSGADITFGYDNRSTGFTERFRMKANGALVVNGNAGTAGQTLTSNGGNAVSWQSPTNSIYNNMMEFLQSTGITTTGFSYIPELNQTISTPACKVLIILKGQMRNNSCLACGGNSCKYDLYVDNTLIDRTIVNNVNNGEDAVVTNGAQLYTLTAGSHTLAVGVDGNGKDFFCSGFRLVVLVIPQ
jgi:hypothetical protein